MGMENGSAAMENSLEAPQKLNIELPYDPVIAIQVHTQRNWKQVLKTLIGTQTTAHSSIINSVQKVETA